MDCVQSALIEQGLLSVAREIAVRAGVLQRCEVCDEVTGGLTGDSEPAFRAGNYMITYQHPLAAAFVGDRHLMMEAVAAVCGEGVFECRCSA
jgi:hypothetical protein